MFQLHVRKRGSPPQAPGISFPNKRRKQWASLLIQADKKNTELFSEAARVRTKKIFQNRYLLSLI